MLPTLRSAQCTGHGALAAVRTGVHKYSSVLTNTRVVFSNVARGSKPSRRSSHVRSTKMLSPASKNGAATILVISSPDSPELSVLKGLPQSAKIVAIAREVEDFESIPAETLAQVDVLLSCGVGARAGKRETIEAMLPRLPSLQWLHSSSAGLEHMLSPTIINHPLVLTNAKGVYSHSLAEYTLTACNWFAKDLPRLCRAQKEHLWEPYDVEELRGKTLGVVGYGDIGQACARLARAYKMRVVALRRRTQLSQEEREQGLVDAILPPEMLTELMSLSDYVVASTPHTPETHKLISKEAIAAMKPSGVFINVGRGKCVDEEALVEALQARRIRGAALDVFFTEPLPADSPLWDLDNVLMSPHNADRTKEFQFESLQLFVDNVNRFVSGEPIKNICDKKSGY